MLDTNVLLSACLKPDGLEASVVDAAIACRLQPFVTAAIEAEYRDVLTRPKFFAFRERAESLLTGFLRCAVRVQPGASVTAAADQDDNRFLECAEASAARFLITGNLRHFPAEWCETRIVNCRQFLEATGFSAYAVRSESGNQAMLQAPNLSTLPWLQHGFGFRDSIYPPGIVTARQIHSAIVMEAGEPIAEADAIVTRAPGTLVGVRTADCVPILLADSRTQAVAAVHAGWRGTAAEIVTAAIRELITRYGSEREDLHAAIGPAIGRCCYEVGRDVAQRFGTEASHLDLAAINEEQLRRTGVNDVWRAKQCTSCEQLRYFSYRRNPGEPGRMISFVGTVQQ